MRKSTRTTDASAFTLIELIVAITIMFLIIGFFAPALRDSMTDARAKQGAAVAQVLNTAAERAHQKNIGGSGVWSGFSKQQRVSWFLANNFLDIPPDVSYVDWTNGAWYATVTATP